MMISWGEYLKLLALVLALSIAFYPLELLAPAEKKQSFVKRLINLAYVPLFLLAAIAVVQPVANAIVLKMFALTGNGLLPSVIGQPRSFAQHFFFAVGYAFWWDLWQYWLHRLQHQMPWLWETHKFHHSDTALNATTQSRHHLLHSVFGIGFYLPVLLVTGTQTPHYVAIFIFFRLWGFVNHANIRLNLGRLTPMLAGPQWHRIHHSALDEHRDRNFATFFPIIDMMFGTYYRPAIGEFPPTGLQGGEPANPLAEASVGPLVAWFKSVRKRVVRIARSQSKLPLPF